MFMNVNWIARYRLLIHEPSLWQLTHFRQILLHRTACPSYTHEDCNTFLSCTRHFTFRTTCLAGHAPHVTVFSLSADITKRKLLSAFHATHAAWNILLVRCSQIPNAFLSFLRKWTMNLCAHIYQGVCMCYECVCLWMETYDCTTLEQSNHSNGCVMETTPFVSCKSILVVSVVCPS